MPPQETFCIISGGPGAGKTTLLDALAKLGYIVIPEDARKIIRQQVNSGGAGLPWKDKHLYLQLMLKASLETYQLAQSDHADTLYFFDRGIIDALCYAKLIGLKIDEEMDRIARTNLYHSCVFLLPPWEEIYHTDTERKQTWKEVEETYLQLKNLYTHYGYQVIELPKDTVEHRRDYVLKKLAEQKLAANSPKKPI